LGSVSDYFSIVQNISVHENSEYYPLSPTTKYGDITMNLKTLAILSSLLITTASHAEIISKEIDYKQGDTIMKGMLAYDDDIKGKRPGVLIVHEWWGHNKHARDKAMMLAEEGYVAFAVDMYGNRKNAEHPDDAGKFSSAVAGNMPLAKARFIAAMDTLKQQPNVEADQLAAMGGLLFRRWRCFKHGAHGC
jgi:hypothetical protein